MGYIQIELAERLATLTIERPPLNILNLDALAELEDHLERLSGDDELQLLIVRGGGEKAFSAGVAVEDHTPDKVAPMLERFHGALRQLVDFPTPTIAAIRGHCLGGGMELAAACDMRVAEERSRFGQPEIELGCFPPWAAAQYPALLSLGATVDLILTGRIIDTSEAQTMGFLDRVVPDGTLEETVNEIARQMLAKSQPVSRLAVRAIRARRQADFGEALTECERLYNDELTQTTDMHEGLDAFMKKRKPNWQHR